MCDICGVAYTRGEHLRRHQLSHGSTEEERRPFTCPVQGCSARFTSTQHVRRHMIIHERDKPFKCTVEECEESFAKQAQLRRHMCLHTGKLPYLCDHPGCDKSFATAQKLRCHSKVHSEELRYHCGHSECGKAFSKWTILQKHIRDEHSAQNCPICFKTFKRKDTLKSHLKTHDASHVPEVPCDFEGCPKVFMTRKSMMVHYRSNHLNERPFTCEYEGCDSRFAHKHLLIRHLKLHEVSRLALPYQYVEMLNLMTIKIGASFSEKEAQGRISNSNNGRGTHWQPSGSSQKVQVSF